MISQDGVAVSPPSHSHDFNSCTLSVTITKCIGAYGTRSLVHATSKQRKLYTKKQQKKGRKLFLSKQTLNEINLIDIWKIPKGRVNDAGYRLCCYVQSHFSTDLHSRFVCPLQKIVCLLLLLWEFPAKKINEKLLNAQVQSKM